MNPELMAVVLVVDLNWECVIVPDGMAFVLAPGRIEVFLRERFQREYHCAAGC